MLNVQSFLAGARTQAKIPSRERLHRLRMVSMRAVATLLLAVGLARGAFVLGFSPVQPSFVEGTLGVQTASVALAVLTLIAATGLWMAATWGTALWASLVICEAVLFAFAEPEAAGSGLRLAGHVALFGAYVIFASLVDRRRRARRWEERKGWVDE